MIIPLLAFIVFKLGMVRVAMSMEAPPPKKSKKTGSSFRL